ncbi:MAG: hypothetical protein ABI045_02795 [Flavobacteriales bacterium]
MTELWRKERMACYSNRNYFILPPPRPLTGIILAITTAMEAVWDGVIIDLVSIFNLIHFLPYNPSIRLQNKSIF